MGCFGRESDGARSSSVLLVGLGMKPPPSATSRGAIPAYCGSRAPPTLSRQAGLRPGRVATGVLPDGVTFEHRALVESGDDGGAVDISPHRDQGSLLAAGHNKCPRPWPRQLSGRGLWLWPPYSYVYAVASGAGSALTIEGRRPHPLSAMAPKPYASPAIVGVARRTAAARRLSQLCRKDG
jgi:hypothetical protein